MLAMSESCHTSVMNASCHMSLLNGCTATAKCGIDMPSTTLVCAVSHSCHVIRWSHCNTLQHTVTHCKPLQHAATHCNTLQHTATLCNTLQHTATHCNTLQHTATHCNTLQHTATPSYHTLGMNASCRVSVSNMHSDCQALHWYASCHTTFQMRHVALMSHDTMSVLMGHNGCVGTSMLNTSCHMSVSRGHSDCQAPRRYAKDCDMDAKECEMTRSRRYARDSE